MAVRVRAAYNEQALLNLGMCGILLIAIVFAIGAPSLYWLLLEGVLAAAVLFLVLCYPVAFCVSWLIVTALTLEMTLNDLVGPAAFQATIAGVKGCGILLVIVCAFRYGTRWDPYSPAWGFGLIAATGLVHGLYPGLTATDSLRSLLGSASPYAFGFVRVPAAWARTIIRATIWCPPIAVMAGAGFAVAGLRPMFVDSGGWRLAGLGHPAFLAGICLPAIYAGLIEVWRDGRPRDRLMIVANLLILVLTGARAPLAYALAVGGMTVLTVPSRSVSSRDRFLVVTLAGLLLPVLMLLAGDLTTVRLFNVVANDAGNLSGRQYLWPAFEAAAAGSPWLGWGLGAGNVIISPASPIAQMLHTWAAHNEYLRMEVEGGQIGRTVLILLFGLWAWSNTRPLTASERRILRYAFVAFGAHAFTDNVLISTPSCVLFTFVIAVFARGRAEQAARASPRPAAFSLPDPRWKA